MLFYDYRNATLNKTTTTTTTTKKKKKKKKTAKDNKDRRKQNKSKDRCSSWSVEHCKRGLRIKI